MDIIQYDSKKLIDFYIKNGLEFDENKDYFGTNIKSFAILQDGKVIVAISISTYKNKNFIEAIAVDEKYRHSGYGKIMLEKVILEINTPIYAISKIDAFFLNNGFVYSDEDLIDKECKACKEYNITCFPKVVILK